MNFVLALISTVSALAGIYMGARFAVPALEHKAVAGAPGEHGEALVPSYVAPELFVYPLQDGNALGGYVVARFVVQLKPGAAELVPIPDPVVLADAFYTSMFALRTQKKATDEPPPVDKLAASLLDAANSNAGNMRFENILVQQFDVFEPNTMRRQNVRDRMNKEEVKPVAPKQAH